MMCYHNQATQVLLVDIPSLVRAHHHPGMSRVASCLRDTVSLTILSTSQLVPYISLLISWADHTQTLLPITPINTSTAKAVTTAILKMDQAMNKMDRLEENMDRSNLAAAISRVAELLGQHDMEVQLHVLTCRSMPQMEDVLDNVVQLERWPPGLRKLKILSPAVDLDGEEDDEQTSHHLERITFTDRLDLDTYFREWLVHQSSENSDMKVDLSHRGIREVLQMDLRARFVEFGDKNRVVEQVERMTVLKTVYQAGVCQSLLMGEILTALPTSATLLGWRELEENKEKVAALHRELSNSRKCLLMSSVHNIYFLVPCPTPSPSFLLGKLSTGELLLPLPEIDNNLGTVGEGGRRVVEVLRELGHQDIYNPLEYNMGKLDSAREKLASARQGIGEKVGGGRGSRGRGRGNRGKMPVVHIV